MQIRFILLMNFKNYKFSEIQRSKQKSIDGYLQTDGGETNIRRPPRGVVDQRYAL